MRRILIITYYWPPSGGSAVLRWVKFAKYLRDYDWEPVIYTPSNPEPQEYDESLLSDIPPGIEIVKRRIHEPYSLYKLLSGKKKTDRLGVALMDQSGKRSRFSDFSLWIRSNFFIPDPRIFWVRPSVRYLNNYLKINPVHAIITTGPPHSMHLIGLQLKKKSGIKWIADFRDPWTNIDFYKQLRLSKQSDQKHRRLEQSVMESADHVITVSPGMTAEFRSSGINRITTITNGFDEYSQKKRSSSSNGFSLIHLGSMPSSRNPEILWKALSELIQLNSNFRAAVKIRLIGKIDSVVVESLKRNELLPYVVNEAYIPHAQTPDILSTASVLLLVINNTPNATGILTNKFFEYLSVRRPILAIGPTDGDASVILNETKSGKMYGFDDQPGVKKYLSELFDLYSQNLLTIESGNIDQYSRKNLTGKLALLLNDITSE